MYKKETIVGFGNVGATAAHWMASKALADVVCRRFNFCGPRGYQCRRVAPQKGLGARDAAAFLPEFISRAGFLPFIVLSYECKSL
jgi:hypothetical protein